MRGPRRSACLLLGLCAAASVADAPAQVAGEPVAVAQLTGGFGFNIDLSRLLSSSVEIEPGELLILWHGAEESKDGLRWMKDRYQLDPVQVDVLDALGLILAQFKTGSPSAQDIKAQLRREQPTWVVDLNTRNVLLADPGGLPAASMPRLYALGQLGLSPTAVDPPRAFRLGVADTAFELTTRLHVGRLVVRDMLEGADVPAPVDHGTAIARLIAGAPQPNGFSGVSRGFELFWARTVRMVDGQPRSNTALMSRAVGWLADQGVDAINISQGGPGDDILKEVFARLTARSILMVAAAGNGGPRAGPVFPAAYPGVLAVTAIDAQAHIYAQANQGSYVALAAPGVDVWVPATTADQEGGQARGGQYLSGTSFASALVAGSLAHADAALWGVPSSARIARLCSGARDLGEPGRDPVFGCGLLRLTEEPGPTLTGASTK